MLITHFRRAGATGHVFFLRSGKPSDKGIAYSGLVGPLTTVAVVPTTSQIIDFAVETRTKDKQPVTVTGNLKVKLAPGNAVTQFDFTVDPRTGSYLTQWETMLHEVAVARVLAPIHEKAGELNIENAIQAQKQFEDTVTSAIKDAPGELANKGILIESCSIPKIEPEDDQVASAIGASERQTMLTQADRAVHERRLNAAENERTIKTYEAATSLKLEEERAMLIGQQSKNKAQEAKADAEAATTRLAVYKDIPAGEMLGSALGELARGGRVNSLYIVPELLTALQGK